MIEKAKKSTKVAKQVASKASKRVVNTAGKLLPLPARKHGELGPEDVQSAREYISEFWKRMERYHPKDDESLLGLPKPYLVPSYEEGAGFDYNELYYWDSFFMVQGLLDGEHQALVSGILEDILSLFKRFKIIPNGSRTFLMGPIAATIPHDIHF